MTFKIQTAGAYGWGDVKVAYDDSEDYEDWHFKTRKEAQAELEDFRQIDPDLSDYRIVPTTTPSEEDFYS